MELVTNYSYPEKSAASESSLLNCVTWNWSRHDLRARLH